MEEMEKIGLLDSPIAVQQYTIDTMVICIMCECEMLLSELVAHQQRCTSRLKWKTKSILHGYRRCLFCSNHPWVPKSSMARHIQRKHSTEFQAIKAAPATKLTVIKAVKCDKVKEIKETVSSVAAEKIAPQPTVERTTVKAEEKTDVLQPGSYTANVYPSVRIERDDDGFDDLVLTFQ